MWRSKSLNSSLKSIKFQTFSNYLAKQLTK